MAMLSAQVSVLCSVLCSALCSALCAHQVIHLAHIHAVELHVTIAGRRVAPDQYWFLPFIDVGEDRRLLAVEADAAPGGDDAFAAVPRAIRDGSFALGATQGETIRKVLLPAALPGIMGAVLMAASRAIGETMIVVMGAGAAAQLSLNPFDAMTTMTVKIVGQLTGDTDFASPETLVAFALGLTLFVITLVLNVLALYIVRKYREQYE